MSIISQVGRAGNNIVKWITVVGNYMVLVAILMIFCLMVTDIIGRQAFNHPLPATYELVELTMVIVIAAGIPYAQMKNRQIRAEFLVERLPARVRDVVEVIGSALGVFIIGLMSWQLIGFFKYSLAINELSIAILTIPIYPFKFLYLCMMWILFIHYLIGFIASLRKFASKKVSDSQLEETAKKV